jgi:hypothetical protein
MPSQFSAVGFHVTTGEDLSALASRVAGEAETITVSGGAHLRYSPPSGEQLWLQVAPKGDAMGMNPHFAGKSEVRVGIEARIARKGHTPLDGTFLGWANPPAGAATGGDYPFAFDCPDAATHLALELPVTVVAQVAAFAQQVTLYASREAYDASQAAQGQSFTSRSFIPSGLFSPNGVPVNPPEAHALFAGHVLEAEERQNWITGRPYCWALVETLGGSFDVVIDPEMLSEAPRAGNVLSGWFWLSGRLHTTREDSKPASGWLKRLTGR